MKTQCIEVSLEDNPMEVLKGCITLLDGLEVGFVDDYNSHLGIKVLIDVMKDAASRIDNKKERVRK